MKYALPPSIESQKRFGVIYSGFQFYLFTRVKISFVSFTSVGEVIRLTEEQIKTSNPTLNPKLDAVVNP